MINVIQPKWSEDLDALVHNGTVSDDNAYGTYEIKKHDEWVKQGKSREMTMDDLESWESIDQWKAECELPSQAKIHIAEYDQIQQWCKDGILERGWPELEKNHEEWEAKHLDMRKKLHALRKEKDKIQVKYLTPVMQGGRIVEYEEHPIPEGIEKYNALQKQYDALVKENSHHNLHGKKY